DANAGDTEDDLLPDPGFPSTLIKPPGDAPHLFGIPVEVGIQQVHLRPSQVDLPGTNLHQLETDLYLDGAGVSVGIADERNGMLISIDGPVMLLLPAIRGEGLIEVAFTEQESNGREGDSQIGSGLCVVAGEYTQTAGVDGQALMQAVLHTEIQHTRSVRIARRLCLVCLQTIVCYFYLPLVIRVVQYTRIRCCKRGLRIGVGPGKYLRIQPAE